MKIKITGILVLLLFVGVTSAFAQSHRQKAKNYFGIQFKPMIPLGLVGDKPFTIRQDDFETEISPLFGYSYGAAIRIGMTEFLSIETGVNYTKRRYRAEYNVLDSNLTATDDIGYVSFDIPLNLLVYVKLGNQLYMNVSGGASMNFNPSNIRSHITPDQFKKDVFILEGRRYNFFDFHANAEVGFEYRTDRSGAFYLGMAGRVPFGKVLRIATEYRYDTHSQVAYGDITGATFSLHLKYFFPLSTSSNTAHTQRGPIEF